MKNKIIYTIFFVVVVLGALGIVVYALRPPTEQKLNQENFVLKQAAIEVSVSDLASNPVAYTNKVIQTKGIVRFVSTGRAYLEGDWFLEDNNSMVQILPWLPGEVAPCQSRSSKCKGPSIMPNYLDKKVQIVGVLNEHVKEEYINQKWTSVGTYYVITIEASKVKLIE